MPIEQPLHLEVLCSECGKAIPTIPTWLVGAKVQFECEECRQKHPRIPGAEPELRRPGHDVVADDSAVLPDEVEDEEETDEDVDPIVEADAEIE